MQATIFRAPQASGEFMRPTVPALPRNGLVLELFTEKPLFLLATLLELARTVSSAEAPMLGFNARDAAAERALETRFDATLDPADYRALLGTMAAAPNQVGSP